MHANDHHLRFESLMKWIRHPDRLDPLFLFAMSIVVTTLWFRGSSLVLGGDYAGVAFHPQEMAGQYLSSWNFWTDTGSSLPLVVNNQVPPIDLIFYLGGSMLGLSAAGTEWAYMALLSYFLGACATYFLARVLFDGRIYSARLAALVAASFYILNPTYVYASGALAIVGSSIPRSGLPLALFLLVAGLKKRDLRYGLGLGLSSLLLFAVFARAMEITFFIVIAAGLALPYVSQVRRHIETVKFGARFIAAAALTTLTVNLFWIVPFAANSGAFFGQLSSYPTSFVAFESQYTTPVNVFRLQGNWTLFVGTYVPYAAYFGEPLVLLITFLLPVVVVAPLGARLKWGPERLTLAILLVLFMALGLGTNLPFHLYEGLIAYVPFFKLFKDPWVFLEPLALVYSLLLGLSADQIARFLAARFGRPSLTKAASLGVALVLLGTLSAPILTGAAYVNWYQPTQRGVTVPPDYQEFSTWLERQRCDCAVLLAPKLTGAYVATNWGYQGPNALYRNLLPDRLIIGAGSPVYSLQSAQAGLYTSYVYDMLSDGDPLDSPIPLNGTQDLASWSASSGSQPNLDSVVVSGLSTPWSDSAVDWRVVSEPTQPSVGHSLTFFLNSTLDLSSSPWLDFWISSTFGESALDLGIQDESGATGWYSLAPHALMRNGTWSLIAIPTMTPDGGSYNRSQVSDITIQTIDPIDGSPAPVGSGSISVGTFRLSKGSVLPNLVRFLLRTLNVGYVVLDASVNGSFYPALDPTPYKLRLAGLPNLVPIQQIGNLTVYLNEDPGTLLSIPDAWIQLANFYTLSSEFRNSPSSYVADGFLSTAGLPSRLLYTNGSLLEVQKNGPADFIAQVSAHGEFLLTLSTSYDPGWVATVDGMPAGTHLVANGYGNGWLFNLTGSVTIEIHFAGQTAFGVAVTTSIVVLIATSVFSVLGLRRLSSAAQMVWKTVRRRMR